MLMATPLGQDVTPQEVSSELTARGYYPLMTTPAPSVSPGIVQVQPVTTIKPPVSPPSDTYPTGEWITDRYPPGYDPVVQPVSPPVVLFPTDEGPPVSPSIYEQFITKSVQPVLRYVEEGITVEPPVRPEVRFDLIFPEPTLDLPPLSPEVSVSPPPQWIIDEFPEVLPDVTLPVEPLPDWELPYEPLPDWELPYSPPAEFPISPLPELAPKDKKGVYILIAVLGAAVLLAGDDKEKKAKRPVVTVENRKEYWS